MFKKSRTELENSENIPIHREKHRAQKLENPINWAVCERLKKHLEPEIRNLLSCSFDDNYNSTMTGGLHWKASTRGAPLLTGAQA